MKAFATLLFLASIALNAAFLTGCVTRGTFVGGETPPKPADDGRSLLVPIAERLGIPVAGKQASDLKSAILYTLGREATVPAAFDDESFEKMAEDLTAVEKEAMCDYQDFIKRLQGKRVIVFDREDWR